MPELNHKGPENEGPKTGRALGRCKKKEAADTSRMGVGQGLRRRSGGGQGEGKRLRSSKLFENQNIDKDENCSSNKK